MYSSFDAENEMARRRAEAQALGNEYLQVAHLRRHRRFNMAGLLALFKRLRRQESQVVSGNNDRMQADSLPS